MELICATCLAPPAVAGCADELPEDVTERSPERVAWIRRAGVSWEAAPADGGIAKTGLWVETFAAVLAAAAARAASGSMNSTTSG
jgi:hypothetical protein